MPILLVEDNARLVASLSRGLTEEGFTVEAVTRGTDALTRLSEADLDGIVLDLGLPDIEGRQVITAARDAGLWVPILVLTARDALRTRVDALEAGADDFLVKPVAFEELLARLRAVMRRAAAPRWAPLGVPGLSLEAGALEVRVGDRRVGLSPREHAFLALLLRRRGEVLSRPEILRQAFGYDFDPGTNLVDVHLAHLRRKLRGAPVRIETVRGAGFRLVAREDDVG